MTRNSTLIRRVASALGRFRSAVRVTEAARGHRSPAPTDLERLGISVVAFGAINKA